MTALQAYVPGTGTISASYGSGSYKAQVDVFCAPDIPYVAWYVNQLNGPKPAPYDQRLKPFTHTVHGNPFFGRPSFKCTGLAAGRYLVWIQYTLYQEANFSGASQQNANGAPPDVQTNGEISSYSTSRQIAYQSGIGSGRGSGGFSSGRTGTREVVVDPGATAYVDF